MINPINFKALELWWIQFPIQLKIITKIRFFSAFGAGGVIYLTSLIFNNIGFSATDIGLGFTFSAIIGTLTRLLTGYYLNFNKNIDRPLKISCAFSILASIFLISANQPIYYLIGQSLIGAAAGIYWPSAELAVPYLCHPIDTSKAYALVRSSEALGIFLGVFLGSFCNYFFYLKFVFINDIVCMLFIISLLIINKEKINIACKSYLIDKDTQNKRNLDQWNKNTKLIILSVILLTTCLALVQVTLPLDFVKGGISRDPLSKNLTSYLISLQLVLLFIFQWPIGNWLSMKKRLFGLKFSLIIFFFSTLLLFISSYLKTYGITLMIIAIVLFSIGTSSFLPTSTDIVFRIAPINKKGFALALLSQCFAFGYFIGPLLSGRILDIYGNASIIWLLTSILCLFLVFNLLKKEY